MPQSLTLFIGNSFTEASLGDGDEVIQFDRWYHPHSNLKKTLQFIKDNWKIDNLENIVFSTSIIQKILHRRVGSAPALLVTAGFENWPEMNLPVKTDFFTIKPKRNRSPLDRDLIFGLTERTDHAGNVDQAIDQSELEFLVSKLQLHNVNKVAICFLHSCTNAQNEQQAKEFFHQQGFQVFISSDNPGPKKSENSRWWPTLLQAYSHSSTQEFIEDLQSDFAIFFPEVPILFYANNSLHNFCDCPQFFSSIFSRQELIYLELEKNFKTEYDQILYMGLEEFELYQMANPSSDYWPSEFGSLLMKCPNFAKLNIQPNQGLTNGFWQVPEFSDENTGYEPGPMCFGRSVKPQLMDLLFITKKLPQYFLSTGLVKEKSLSRIRENLQALSAQQGNNQSHVEQIANHLLKEASVRILNQCFQEGPKKTLVVGPYAGLIDNKSAIFSENITVQSKDPFFTSNALLNFKELKNG